MSLDEIIKRLDTGGEKCMLVNWESARMALYLIKVRTVIEAVEETLSIETPKKVLDALKALA